MMVLVLHTHKAVLTIKTPLKNSLAKAVRFFFNLEVVVFYCQQMVLCVVKFRVKEFCKSPFVCVCDYVCLCLF